MFHLSLCSPLRHTIARLPATVGICCDVLHFLLRRFIHIERARTYQKKVDCAIASFMSAQWLWGAQATCTWGSLTVEVAVSTGSHGEGRFCLTPRYTIMSFHSSANRYARSVYYRSSYRLVTMGRAHLTRTVPWRSPRHGFSMFKLSCLRVV